LSKKLFGVFIIMLFILTTINVEGTNRYFSSYSKINLFKPSPNDELDQKQNLCDGYYWGVFGEDVKLAQSFTPTLNIITRVQLRLMRWGSPDGLEISIRYDLNGEDLASIYKEKEEISADTTGFWYEFDFPDFALIPEDTYYIIWSPYGANDKYNTYYWCLKDGNYYDRGTSWNFLDGEWEKLEPDIPKGDPDFTFKTYGISNSPPEKPVNLNGPFIGEIGENLYYESTFNDLDDDILNVYFDWGDGSNSGWIPSISTGIFGLTHSWYYNGSYQIKTKSKDDYFESPWSDPLTLIIGNIPPDKPLKPDGPNSGKILIPHIYSTSTIDHNGDEVFYLFDWGDRTQSEWLGPYASGDTCEATHIWADQGTYPIKVKAKDIYDEESVWSDPLSSSMPKTKLFNQIPKIIIWLFERFTFLHPYLIFY